MQCREALIEFAHLLLIGSTALEKMIDDTSTEAPKVTTQLAEVKAIAERLHEIGHEIETIGVERGSLGLS